MRLASRGLRDLDTGPVAINAAAELARVRRQARRVRLEGMLTGVVLTAVTLLAPG